MVEPALGLECAICLAPIEEQAVHDSVVIPGCTHAFHQQCLDLDGGEWHFRLAKAEWLFRVAP